MKTLEFVFTGDRKHIKGEHNTKKRKPYFILFRRNNKKIINIW